MAAPLDSFGFSVPFMVKIPNKVGQGQQQILAVGNDRCALVPGPGNSNLSRMC